ncbi:hypothetical protein AbHV_ORF87 [Abalone herpesvirus Victoria/AUS/2009]|uniref:Uncharacterized protein n=1 Tax=Abalone herpesvirus (isolate Abalone/Australia/Victoria/2009) TaxID=1241371 RepID=K4JUL3_ABHV|nr:hypothetical protein AbHV_ORF87 [Abalone herpesvirus Victoria/AUS/2009]AFU90099.1 hypothetical protein AbHV_ORF87 [Abalone herpesvirus Victoria/AUS/2009]UCX57074.1 ORF83 [Haliotid herpesvirus 1]
MTTRNLFSPYRRNVLNVMKEGSFILQNEQKALDELNKLRKKYNETFLLNNQQTAPKIVQEEKVVIGAEPVSELAGPSIRTIRDFTSEKDVENMLASLNPHHLLLAAKLRADQSVRDREILLAEIALQFKTPDVDMEAVNRDSTVDLMDQYRLAEHSSSLSYYAQVREDARKMYMEDVDRIDRANSKTKGGISTVTPSLWIKTLVEDVIPKSTASNVLYTVKRAKKVKEEGGEETVDFISYAQDLHHLLSRFGATLSVIPFYPDEVSAGNMKPTLFSDTQMLFHYAASSNPDLVDYSKFYESEFEYLSHPSTYKNFVKALTKTIKELLNIKDELKFQAAGRSLSVFVKTKNKQNNIPRGVLVNLMPFIIDNKSKYDVKEFEKAMKGEKDVLKTKVRDTPLGRQMNFNRMSVAERNKNIKKLMAVHSIPDESEVYIKTQMDIGTLDFVREIYAALMTAATTMNLVKGQGNIDLVIKRLTVKDVAGRKVMYVPSLEAYPGALFDNILYVNGYPFQKDGYKGKTEDGKDFINADKNQLITLFENFVRIIPSLSDTKSEKYMPTLTGIFTAANRHPISFSIDTTENIIQGMRYMDGEVLKRFKINNNNLVAAVTAAYLNKAMVNEVRSSSSMSTARAFFYAQLPRESEYGSLLATTHPLNLPKNYLLEEGYRVFAETPVVYRYKFYTVSLEKEKKVTYMSGEDTTRGGGLYSLLESVIKNQSQVRVEESIEAD